MAGPVPDDQQACLRVALEMLEEQHHLRAFDAAGVNLKEKALQGDAADDGKTFPSEAFVEQGGCPRGAQVPTRVGLVLRPLSSTKTTMRRWRRAFFL
jgi:hypothetical protein